MGYKLMLRTVVNLKHKKIERNTISGFKLQIDTTNLTTKRVY